MPRLRPLIDPKETPPKKEDDLKKDEKLLVQEGNLEPEVEVEPEVDEKEEAAALLRQEIENLKKAEGIQRERADRLAQEREAHLRQARERETQVSKFRKESQQSQYDAVVTAITAATNDAESAKRDIKNAIANGDPDAQADAYERLATARAALANLEGGKAELEDRLKAPDPEPEVVGDQLDKTNLPESAKTWLRAHPEYMTDQRKNTKIQSLHYDVIDEGHAAFSPAYFDSLEIKLGLKGAPKKKEKEEEIEEPAKRTSILSAPVSREAPSTPNQPRGGTIRLTPDQREAAKIAGVSEAEYAKNLKKLNEMKANGSYGDRQ